MTKLNQGCPQVIAQSELRTYCKFKTQFQMEKYLSLPNKNQRASISRFRMSSHPLAIEIGRHSRPKVPEDKRLCTKCWVVQNEMHHLLICSPLTDLRKPLIDSASLAIEGFHSLSVDHQFSEILHKKIMLCHSLLYTYKSRMIS